MTKVRKTHIAGCRPHVVSIPLSEGFLNAIDTWGKMLGETRTAVLRMMVNHGAQVLASQDADLRDMLEALNCKRAVLKQLSPDIDFTAGKAG